MVMPSLILGCRDQLVTSLSYKAELKLSCVPWILTLTLRFLILGHTFLEYGGDREER